MAADKLAVFSLITLLAAITACTGAPPPAPSEPAPAAAPAPAADPEVAKLTPDPVPEPEPEPEPEAGSAVVLDVPTLVGLDQEGAKEMLGEPTRCETTSPSNVGKVPKCYYRGGNVEVVFINGRADWITIAGLPDRSSDEHPALDALVSPDALALLGLPKARGTASPLGLFFTGGAVAGLHEVSLFKTSIRDDRLKYAYVKAKTD